MAESQGKLGLTISLAANLLCDIGQVTVPLGLQFPQLKMGLVIGNSEVHGHVIGQETSFGNHFLLCKARILHLGMNLGRLGSKWASLSGSFSYFPSL